MRRRLYKVLVLMGALTMGMYALTSTYIQILSQIEIVQQSQEDIIVPIKYDKQSGFDSGNNLVELDGKLDIRDIGAPGSYMETIAGSRTLKLLSPRRMQGVLEPNSSRTCKERRNIVFIKCMKCATETMGTIVRRFGYERNLSFVLPVEKNIYLGWPYVMNGSDYRPSLTGSYNVLMEHAIYNKSVMRSVMPSNTAYISIIREPYSHFRSVFNYFNLVNVAKVPGLDPLSEYLSDIEKYDTRYKSHESSPLRYCIPDNFSITKNLMSYCFGMPNGFPEGYSNITANSTAITKYIEQLGADFTLVMLVEYFHESLILLKRLMCWSTRDIIHHSVNILNYSSKTAPPSADNVRTYKQWSSVDYLLYDYFYKLFWKKVGEQSADFRDEVKYFVHIEEHVMHYCYKTTDYDSLYVPASAWNEGFNFTRHECDMMNTNLLEMIKTRYDTTHKSMMEGRGV